MDNLYNRTARRRRRGQGGFTLIELLVVIAVLAVLAGIVIFNVVGVANRGSSSAACTDAKSVQTAVDAALNDGKGGGFAAGGITGPDWTVLVPAYLHTGPAGSPGQPAAYGSQAPNWQLTATGNGGFNVTVGINGC